MADDTAAASDESPAADEPPADPIERRPAGSRYGAAALGDRQPARLDADSSESESSRPLRAVSPDPAESRPYADDAAAGEFGGTPGSGRPGPKQLEGSQSPQLTMEKTPPPEIQVGKPARFEIRVRNTGTVAAQGVEIHDEVPKGTQFVSASPPASQGRDGEPGLDARGTVKPGDELRPSGTDAA